MDARIQKAKDFLQYMQNWKGSVRHSKHFVSDQLWFDLQSMILGLSSKGQTGKVSKLQDKACYSKPGCTGKCVLSGQRVKRAERPHKVLSVYVNC